MATRGLSFLLVVSGALATGLWASNAWTGCGDDGPDPCCLADQVLHALGKDALLVGAKVDEAQLDEFSLDIWALYLAGGLSDGEIPCASCASECTSGGVSCASDGAGCDWWGCWQWDQAVPGDFVRKVIQTSSERALIPLFTYYEFLHASGAQEGREELAALTDLGLMTRYLNDWRFFLQTIGEAQVLVHIEPDLWGFAQQQDSDATRIPAAVEEANPMDCGGLPDDISGLGRCMIRMARSYAPNALVGLHASGWATRIDVLYNVDSGFDVVGEATEVVDFLIQCGGDGADFVVVDISDRDAGYYEARGVDKWWDKEDSSLPHFEQGLGWGRAIASGMGRALLWWQIPVGNESLPDQPGQWRDNRLDYFFDHPDRVAESLAFGMVFGAGAQDQTSPESDGGHFKDRAERYRRSGGISAGQ